MSRRAPTGTPTDAPRDRWGLLAVPGLLFLGFFFLWPVAEMFVRSLTDPAFGMGMHVWFVELPTSVRSLVTTFRTAVITTISCLVVGYPYAYLMSVSRPRIAGLLLALIWHLSLLSFLVRTFASRSSSTIPG